MKTPEGLNNSNQNNSNNEARVIDRRTLLRYGSWLGGSLLLCTLASLDRGNRREQIKEELRKDHSIPTDNEINCIRWRSQAKLMDPSCPQLTLKEASQQAAAVRKMEEEIDNRMVASDRVVRTYAEDTAMITGTLLAFASVTVSASKAMRRIRNRFYNQAD
jgi:hypothetical protein